MIKLVVLIHQIVKKKERNAEKKIKSKRIIYLIKINYLIYLK